MVEYSPFFETILQSIESKGWVDIENDYYQLLKDSINNPRCEYTTTGLNQQLAFIQSKLVEYLSTIKEGKYKSEYQKAITDYFNPDDFSTESRVRALDCIFIHINLLVHFVRAFLMLAFAAMALAITVMSTDALYLFVFVLCTHEAILQ